MLAAASAAFTISALLPLRSSMVRLEGRTTYNCEPTLSDSDVVDFCRVGFIHFDGVVPEEINARCFAFLDEQARCRYGPPVAGGIDSVPRASLAHRTSEPMELLQQDWFVDAVLLCPPVVGAVRSLLGRDFGLPILVSNHRVSCPRYCNMPEWP